MGSPILDILEKEPITYTQLNGMKLAVDTFNQLYMFLTTIRGPDGTPLSDSRGNVTSHLVGLFNRFSNLISQGIRFVFVFDGEAPELKRKEIERRAELKKAAELAYREAEKKGDVDNMKKYSGRTSRLTGDMIDEAKRLIAALGQPIVQAPGEGEAEAASLVKQGVCDAVLSQDADSLLFGAPLVIRNLSIARRRKISGKLAYDKVEPERISLEKSLKKLELTQDQLIALALLAGTDYNVGGIKGLGPKKALRLVKESKNLDQVFEKAKWSKYFDTRWKDVFGLFKNVETLEVKDLSWESPDKDKIIKILVDEHEFSGQRVLDTLEKLDKAKTQQRGLGDFM
ncbi:flap endonuclease-1 [Candidatus Woesearchaeota archaeon]|nr:flap endonuclease-1 [Candidatus Woesearchaeota archaeon]